MTPNRHRIQRQVLELTVGDANAAPGIQEQLARACREPLLAGMTSLFDAVAPAHQLLRLERLEIDVGRIEGGDWAPEFERRLLAELERQLQSCAAQRQPGHAAQSADAGGDEFDAFVFFLRHGRLPWWRRTADPAWSGAFLATDARHIQALRALLHEEPRALTRLVSALDDAALETLVSSISPLRDCTRALHELRPADAAALNQRWRLKFWRTVVAGSLALRDGATAATLVHALLAQRCELALEQSRQRPAVASESGGSGFAPLIRPVNVAALPAFWRAHCEAAFLQMEYATPPAAATGEPVQTASAPGQPRQASRGREPRSASAEIIYLPCAGILLLHPFLKTLFHDRGLLEGGQFIDDPARQRGAQLLGYLATGNTQTPEYELGFAKLLTGIDLEAPLESAWLEEADTAACDALLAAVLGHWTALRSSSAAWLRSQFFLRDGKLETVDGGFRVTVERRAQDVLLARLPWGFGVISLPWLQQRIFVQWLD
jgi:Contractile injection system tape measure protein